MNESQVFANKQKKQSLQPKNIYFIWNYTNWGGAQIYFLAIMKRAGSVRKVKVLLPVNSSPDLISFIEQSGGEIDFLNYHLISETPVSLSGKIKRQIRRILSEIEIFSAVFRRDRRNSVFHIELAPWQSWVLILFLRIINTKLFITIHNPLPEASIFRNFLWRFRLAIVSRLSGVRFFPSNHFTKSEMAKWMSPKAIEKMRVTYTAVDPDLINIALENNTQLDEMRLKFGLDDGRKNILCVGQFIDRKGRWFFLEAASILHESFPDLRFIWLMPSYPSSSDQKKIESFGLGSSFMPVISSDVGRERISILTFMRVADIFALPSFVEGLPIALLEAMALCIPCISTSVYAIPEAVIDNKTGLLVSPGNAQELAESISKLLSDKHLAERIAGSGREFVINNFDERKSADLVLQTYEEEFLNG